MYNPQHLSDRTRFSLLYHFSCKATFAKSDINYIEHVRDPSYAETYPMHPYLRLAHSRIRTLTKGLRAYCGPALPRKGGGGLRYVVVCEE